MTEGPSSASTENRRQDIFIHGVIGGLIGVIFFFVPFSSAVGGGVAGYLQNGSYRQGGKVGLIAGVIMYLPLLAIGIGILGPGVVFQPMPSIAMPVLVAFWLIFGMAYTLGLAFVGGLIGTYVRTEMIELSERKDGTDTTREPISPDESERDESIDRSPSTVLNGVIGGITGLFLSFIPFSMVLGGALAGYLEGGSYADGVKVGAIAGVVAYVPVLVIAMLLVPFFIFVGLPSVLLLGLIFFVLLFFGVIYFVGLAILGAVIGVNLKAEL